MADTLLDCSARGDIVLDAFLGPGSTLIAAERTGRICYGIELDPIYVDTVVKRWQRYTGDYAIHAGTGKQFDEIASKELEAQQMKTWSIRSGTEAAAPLPIQTGTVGQRQGPS